MKTLLRSAVAIAACAVIPFPSYAQDKNASSFDEFRKSILTDYSNFRNRLIEHYEDFLRGEWHEYESLSGEKRNPTPKPKKLPVAEKNPITDKTPVREKTPEKPRNVAPEKQPETQPKPQPQQKPQTTPKPENKPRPKPKPEPKPQPETRPAEDVVDIPHGYEFNFYSLPLTFPEVSLEPARHLGSPAEYASHWNKLASSSIAETLLPAIKQRADEMGLNDYLTYDLIRAYVDSRFADSDDTAKTSLVHYLLVNMGYDARLAVTDSGIPLLLLPFEQPLYDRAFLTIPGGKYYVFTPDGVESSQLGGARIRTCALPADIDKGNKIDLVLGELRIPVKPKPFDLEYGDIHIRGEVNENLMPILYRYPQMPIEDYARSNIDPALRRSLSSQIKEQLAGMDSDAATDHLLEFMHNVFQYSTDQENHGFEKPYFLEETLYYPKNDCEDRAIFYTYFLWNALGKEAQLVSFPGHEASTVRLDSPIDGKSYDYKGKTFYISDPTYIGSHTGMPMPIYVNEVPSVDYTYE